MLGLRPGAHDSPGPGLLLPVLAESAAETLAEGPDSVAGIAVCSQGAVGVHVDLTPSLGVPCHSRLVSAAGSSARQRGRFPPLGETGKGGRPQAPTCRFGQVGRDGWAGGPGRVAAMQGVDHPGVG